MGNNNSEIVLLFDNYSVDSENLHTSFKSAGKDYPAVVIEDNGFLPEDVISVYGYFLGDYKTTDNAPGRPRYFNQVEVPEYWEISGNNNRGKIKNLTKERGRIFYAEPKHKRLVRVVDWCDENGIVRCCDHYNRYGAIYARTIFNAKGKKVNKSYFSVDGQEIIVENFVTGDIILNDGELVKIFHTKTDFVRYFLEKSGYMESRLFFNSLSTPFFVSQSMSGERKEDILFWQEPARLDIPGNMQIILDGKATRASKIIVQKRTAYDKLIELGASPEMVQRLGFIYSFEKNNGYQHDALICTNSDRIANIEKIVEELPNMQFHIAALTEMSSKLMSLGRYENVKLYPGIKRKILDELFDNCDFYLDINYEAEIVSAVREAFLHNHMIFAFQDTIHNRDYIAEEAIYGQKPDEVKRMIVDIRMIMLETQFMDAHLELQHKWAMTENVEKYLDM